MPKKRKTLPKDFAEIVERGDIEEIKKALSGCEPNAYSGYNKDSALMNTNLPQEVIVWLVKEYGADINYANTYGNTALSEAARWKPENIELLLSLGADINFHSGNFGATALINGASVHRVEGVRELIRCGADINITGGYFHHDALTAALSVCKPIDIRNTAEIAKILLGAGVKTTPEMKEYVTKIGTEFEFHRDGFNLDYLDDTDAALQELYKLFDVAPVPKRQQYDGSEPIKVKSETWQKQYSELWDMLVPSSGSAVFVQGEAIRIFGKLSYEVLDNGGGNWDAQFRKIRDALAEYLVTGQPADEVIIQKVKNISPDTEESVFDEIAEAVVKWILANPEPVLLGEVDYKR